MKWLNPTQEQILEEIKILVDSGDNIEYTRGVLEIITSFMKGDDDMCCADKVLELAEILKLDYNNISKLY